MRALTLIILIAVGLAADAAQSEKQQRMIVGGTTTTIENFPYVSALLYSPNLVSYGQSCVGTIINNRSILTTSSCVRTVLFTDNDAANRWRIRVGSSYANSGGIVHNVNRIITHPGDDDDVAILHSSSAFLFSNSVRAGSIAGSNYNVGDYNYVRAVGWGKDEFDGELSEQLRSLTFMNFHWLTCRLMYLEISVYITENMMCSGWLDFANYEDCLEGSGLPIIHNNVVVGLSSFGFNCPQGRYPAISTRVSNYTSWIQSNA